MILVIPDIHNKIDAADEIVRRVGADVNIFLGDYFDNFGDSVQDARNVARWLRDRSRSPENIFLWGNHDFHYSPYATVRGGGYRRDKQEVIHEVSPFHRLQFAVSVGDILLTHAGFSLDYWNGQRTVAELVEHINESDPRSPLIQGVGKSRGGEKFCGGILWCDHRREFKPIPLVRQIFGHTELREEEQPAKEYNINIDKQLRYHALIEDGKITIGENKTGG